MFWGSNTSSPGIWMSRVLSFWQSGVKSSVVKLAEKKTSREYPQGINISHLGKRKIIFKIALVRDMLVFGGVSCWLLRSPPSSFPIPKKDSPRHAEAVPNCDCQSKSSNCSWKLAPKDSPPAPHLPPVLRLVFFLLRTPYIYIPSMGTMVLFTYILSWFLMVKYGKCR